MYKFETAKEKIKEFEDCRRDIIDALIKLAQEENGILSFDAIHRRVREDYNEYDGYVMIEENMTKLVLTEKGPLVHMKIHVISQDWDDEEVDEDIEYLTMDELFEILEGI